MYERKVIVEIHDKRVPYDKVRHLMFIEDIIKRQADNSFNIKKLCVTIFVAIIALAINGDMNTRMKLCCLWLACFVVIIFMFLDAYYLSMERGFKKLYNEVCLDKYDNYHIKLEIGFWNSTNAVTSKSVWIFYIALIVLTFLFMLLIGGDVIYDWCIQFKTH